MEFAETPPPWSDQLGMKKKKDSKAKHSPGSVSRVTSGARSTNKSLPTVLHIDDDSNDTELLEAATRKAQAQFILHTVHDGEQAMVYLNGHGVYADRTRYAIPSLVLLDLKMPRATGFEVLKWIRSQPLFRSMPVVILSGSQLKDDMQAAYAAGADSYKVKPLGFSELVNLVKDLDASWVTRRTNSIAPPSLRAHQERL